MADEEKKENGFAERFNAKYKERLAKDEWEAAKKNDFYHRYVEKLSELYGLVCESVEGTPIEIGREKLKITRKVSSFDAEEVELEKLRLGLGNYFILLTPEGVDYDTGAAIVDIEHNNIREKPLHISLHLQFTNRTEENPSGELQWMLKIGYKNYKHFDRELIENLIEGVFLS
ncbi:MAG: hypothetical protein E3J72_13650 [Planctomycetota bacterium]|nr:MAG: hypothetical protein E3J72_13650 [Planctomycetota bacterium]